jgi:hypothetical protein
MWLSPGLLGPQNGPACSGRLKAQWRQVDVENREAMAVRRQWMTLLGIGEDEIAEKLAVSFDLCLADELEELLAAMGLC